MLLASIWAFFISLIVGGLLVRLARKHAGHYPSNMPQRFHKGDVPRVGGVALAAGIGAGILVGLIQTYRGDPAQLRLGWWVPAWGLCMLPALIGGVLEDFQQSVPVRWRFTLTLCTALLAVFWLGATVPRVGIAWLDNIHGLWPWLGMAIALLAIGGLPHAFNIIDGYNGLACMVAIIVLLALTHVSIQVQDRSLAVIFLVTAAASAGFLVWNYPRGLLFAGDGGAYLWGSVLSIGSILLVQRHPIISPWFPVLLLIYPVWETTFSVYRKWIRGGSASVADALHIHQLIYRRLVHGIFDRNQAREMLKRNNRTSPYLWGFTILTVLPAILFWRHTWVLMSFCILFAAFYTYIYISIVRFKVPAYMRWHTSHPPDRN